MNDDSLSSSDSSSDEEGAPVDLVVEDLELQRLEDTLRQNPYDYDGQMTRIKALRARQEWPEVRRAREAMAAVFPLTEALWLAWTGDETQLASSPAEQEAVAGLFERAVNDYVSVRIWREYVSFVRDVLRDERRSAAVLERALAAAGLDMAQGSDLWALLVEQQMGAGEQELRDAFRRWLSVPHTQHQSTLARYQAWESEPAQSPLVAAVVKAHERAAKLADARAPYEQKVADATAETGENGGGGDPSLVQAWQEYIAFEEKEAASASPARVVCVFERCLRQVPLRADVWHQYAQFCARRLAVAPAGCTASCAVVERALRNVPWSGPLHAAAVRAAERAGPAVATPAFVVGAVGRGVANQLAGGATDYTGLMDAAIDCAVRAARARPAEADAWRHALLQAMVQGSAALRRANHAGLPPTLGPVDHAAWALCSVFSECHTASDAGSDAAWPASSVDCARQLYEQYVRNKRAAANPATWCKYLEWEERFGGPVDTVPARCRALFQRALAACSGPPRRKHYQPQPREAAQLAATASYLLSLRLSFEGRWGTLEEWTAVEQAATAAAARAQRAQQKLVERNAVAAAAAATSAAVAGAPSADTGAGVASSTVSVGSKRASASTADDRGAGKRQKKGSTKQGSDQAAEHVDVAEDAEMVSAVPQSVSIASTAAAAAAAEPQPVETEPEFSVFVGSIPFHVTETQLQAVFEAKLGGPEKLKSIRIMCDANGVSKGRGFVHFHDAETAQLALDLNGYQFDGRSIRVTAPRSKTSGTHAGAGAGGQQTGARNENCVVFVGKLAPDTAPSKIRTQFAAVGPVFDVRKRPNRTFAYVEFEEEASVALAVAQLNGVDGMTVAKSNPPPKKQLNAWQSARKEARLEAAVAGVAPARSRPRSLLVTPRSVSAKAAAATASATPSALEPPAATASVPAKPVVKKSNADFRKLLGI